MTAPERILVRAPNWLGDVVLSLPALRDLARSFPRARLEVLARPAVAELYGAVAEVHGARLAAGTRADAAAVRGAFDLGVLFTNSFGSALALRLGGVPERWGYATEVRGPLLTRRARVPAAVRGRSQVYYYRAMLAGLGLRVSAEPDASLAAPAHWREAALRLLGSGPWVGLNPGAAYGAAKRWPAARFAATGDALAERTGARVVVLGTASERPLADAVAAAMRHPARVLAGETRLSELVGVLSHLQLLVTNDSGPMHVASALGTPVVAVFGPTDERETAPAGPGRKRIAREPVPCAPCGLRACPIDHACMRRVSAEGVAALALELLAS
ncbi:MAG: lipopolysaccharide heptosyltransferase II [Vicinamibacteria bacterium]